MRRISPVAWLLLALAAAAVAVEPVSTPASMAFGAAAALVAYALVLEVLRGDAPDGVEMGDLQAGPRVTARRRRALRRMFRGRDWGRRAPDAPDEPADLVWERERRRRGLG